MHENVLAKKKRYFYQEKLRENVGKPNKLWKGVTSLDLPSKISQIYPILSNFCQQLVKDFLWWKNE